MFNKLKSFVTSPTLWYFVFLLGVFLANSIHESYPDEFDNISGGKFILQGVFPYSGFLSHHGPFAYYLSAFLNLFSGTSFVAFRLIYAIFLVLMLSSYTYLLKSKFNESVEFLKPYFVILGITATYFWLHMFLADSLSSLMLILPYFYLLLLTTKRNSLTLRDVWIVSLPLSFVVMTALTYSFLVAGLYAFLALLYLRSNHRLFSFTTLRAIGIVFLPYFIFFLTLLGSGALGDYYYQNITYNQTYYIDNYPRSVASNRINPVRYAIVIAKTALDNVADGARHVFTFNIYSPKEIPLLGLNLLFIITLLLSGNYLAIIPVLFFLLFSNPRSSLMSLKELDYQSAVYTVLSLGNGVLAFSHNLRRKLLGNQRDNLLSLTTLGLGIFLTIFSFAMLTPFTTKIFNKYMGTEPAIYNRPEIAPSLNLLLTKDDYVWIGPFEFEELYYLDAKLPSKYHWLLPANAKSDKIRTEMMQDFETNPPTIIVFDHGFGAFGAPPSSFNYFMMDFLKAGYSEIASIADQEGNTYDCNIPRLKDFVCSGQFFVRNDQAQIILSKMIDLNLVTKN